VRAAWAWLVVVVETGQVSAVQPAVEPGQKLLEAY
jgi:hypothetical protein